LSNLGRFNNNYFYRIGLVTGEADEEAHFEEA
jgi:hypothetical protein